MLHLPIERIADLVDGDGTPGEREHLADCVACSRELESYRRLVTMASDERRRIGSPLTDWDSLAPRLRAEGLIRAQGDRRLGSSRPAHRPVFDLARRAAVVVIFVGGGAVLGRMSAGLPITDAVAFRADPALTREAGSGAGTPALAVGNPVQRFATSQDAMQALEHARREYEVAANWLASHDTSSSALAPAQYRTRLAALDRTAETMQQAMRDAPLDPYINQYYLSTLSAREQTLRRLGTALPVGRKLGRF